MRGKYQHLIKKLYNYKGLLVLWVFISILFYGVLVSYPRTKTFKSHMGYNKIVYEAEPTNIDLKTFTPFLSFAGIVLIGGVGYLISKK
ncbi:MAG: hypothetical protein GXO79_10555 [Chlorobi bacterium]|nr:hypothetical protein [Chlorobiota bacterium]